MLTYYLKNESYSMYEKKGLRKIQAKKYTISFITQNHIIEKYSWIFISVFCMFHQIVFVSQFLHYFFRFKQENFIQFQLHLHKINVLKIIKC